MENFSQAAVALTPNNLPDKMKQLSQWSFQEGYIGKTKMPPGIKSIIYVDEDPIGRSLGYMDNNKKLKPNSCSPDKWKSLEETLPHVPPEATIICSHFRKNKCRHGLSGKFPVGNKKGSEAIHPQLCWPFLRHRHGE